MMIKEDQIQIGESYADGMEYWDGELVLGLEDK